MVREWGVGGGGRCRPFPVHVPVGQCQAHSLPPCRLILLTQPLRRAHNIQQRTYVHSPPSPLAVAARGFRPVRLLRTGRIELAWPSSHSSAQRPASAKRAASGKGSNEGVPV